MIKAIVFDCYGVLVGLSGEERPNEDIFAYIRDELKPHYKIAMLSNATGGGPQRHLTAEQLALLDVVVVSGEVGYAKPDPQAFQIVADRLGVHFNEMIFIDDLEKYVVPARDMGIPSILYTGLEPLRQQLAALL